MFIGITTRFDFTRCSWSYSTHSTHSTIVHIVQIVNIVLILSDAIHDPETDDRGEEVRHEVWQGRAHQSIYLSIYTYLYIFYLSDRFFFFNSLKRFWDWDLIRPINQSIDLYLSIYLYIYICVYPSIYLHLYPSVIVFDLEMKIRFLFDRAQFKHWLIDWMLSLYLRIIGSWVQVTNANIKEMFMRCGLSST